MIYRAYDYTCKYHQDSTDIWLQASSDAQASDKVIQLLSLAWDVDADEIWGDSVRSELALERASIQPAGAGDRRWYESGSWGDRPLYLRSTELAFLDPRSLARLYAAKAAARMHARYIYHEIEVELGNPDLPVRERQELDRYLQGYANFDGQQVHYAPPRPVSAPSKDDVRQLRERHDLTQEQASDLVYVTPNAWQKWEQGTRAMDRRTWELLRLKLGESSL